MKANIFLIANPKFQLQILCSFWDIPKMVKLIGIPENNFLCIFITASSPGVHTFVCLWRATTGGNFTKCISEVKVNQLKVKNMHVRMGISTFNFSRLELHIYRLCMIICKVRKKAWFFSRNCEIGNTKSEILRDPVQAVFSRQKCGPNSPPSHILIVTIFPGDFRMILWIKKPSRSVRYSRPPGEDLYFCHNLKFLNKSYLDRISFIREVKIHKHSHNFASSS